MNNLSVQQRINELPKGLILWYNFQKNKKLLCVVNEAEQFIAEGIKASLAELEVEVDIAAGSQLKENNNVYDYIFTIGVLETNCDYMEILKQLKLMLNDNGILLLAMDNRLAIRYFCGDTDKFTSRNFDGIENYFRTGSFKEDAFIGRAYSKNEIQNMLTEAGFSKVHFYSVFPVLERPQILFSENYIPKEDLSVRIAPQYNNPSTVFLDEDLLYRTLIDNGLFHIMANGFLIECTKNGALMEARQVTVSMDRGPENAMSTIIHKDDIVEKKAVYDESRDKVNQILENHEYLKNHGVPVIDAKVEAGSLFMPYIDEQIATNYYADLIINDEKQGFDKLDELWGLILNSSEHVPYDEINWEQFAPYWYKRKKDDPNIDKWKKVAFGTQDERDALGPILKRGYIDLVSLNSFIVDGNPLFFDQELFVENLPAKAILIRTIDFVLSRLNVENRLKMRDVMYERYGLSKYQDLFHSFANEFLNKFRNDTVLSSYNQKYRKDSSIINSNRQRMNFSADEYQRIFYGLFKNTEGKKLYIFGSGNFAKHFISQYSSDYEIAGILDNNSSRWGETLNGIPIYSPQHILSLPENSYKLIICIKNYMSVLRQIQNMGISNYAIYDDNIKIERTKPVQISNNNADKEPKKYHIGYIAGVFDLFHVGHLNMFKRAKEQCDYLIVGVVTDEGVMNGKRTMPFVPFSERIEMVRSCRYVDEAVEIPVDYPGTDEAYKRYQFDVQFSGSDYENDPYWLSMQEYLRKNGSDMVFFPYTQETSSTKLKELIYKKLV